jgi:hypothetical protein
MKTMLAMALVFGFSALGCGAPVDANNPNAPVLEEEAQALTAYTGHCGAVCPAGVTCNATTGAGYVHTGYCLATSGSICLKVLAVECQGTPIGTPVPGKLTCSAGFCGSTRQMQDNTTLCSFTQ